MMWEKEIPDGKKKKGDPDRSLDENTRVKQVFTKKPPRRRKAAAAQAGEKKKLKKPCVENRKGRGVSRSV